MRIHFLILLLVLFLPRGKTQDTRHIEFITGYGFYEGFNIGGIAYFKPRTHTVGLSFGHDRINKQTNMAASASFDIAIFRRYMSKSNHYKWHINNKLVCWQLEDDYYKFRALSIIPSVNRTIYISRGLDISFDVGPSFNIVFYSKRKTFEEVGWPYHIMPDFRILLII